MAKNNFKRLKVTQRFREEYSKQWPCFIKSRLSDGHVFCTVCSCDFSIAHGGRDDCRRHEQSKKHQDYSKVKSTLPIDAFFQTNSDVDVINAEMLYTSYVVEHNIALASTDHAGPLFRAMFPDSKIAKKYACARTKTNALIENMAHSTQKDIVDILQKNAFSLATDGSTDSSDVKLYPVVVSFFDESEGKINTLLLSILDSTDNTGEGIFKILNAEFDKRQIPWKNCVSFACDNANTMLGQHKGVVAFLKQVQPSIIVLGCSCHLIHLAAKKATSALKKVNVESFLVQLYYYLDKSSKRKNSYKLCQVICGTKPHKILKYVNTRWLSLLDAVNRVLEQWNALEEFLCDKDAKSSDLQSFIENPICKLYCLFLSNSLHIFTTINVFLQQEAPFVHLLHRKLMSLFTDILVRFVKPSASDGSTSMLDIDFKKRKIQKNNSDLVIGASTRAYIKECGFSDEILREFYSEVRGFYETAADYMLKKFPLNSDTLKHSEVADITIRKKVKFSSVEFLLTLFPNLLTSDEVIKLEPEFAAYQYEFLDDKSYPRMDIAWNEISKMTDASGVKKYTALPKIMLAVLLIPHSNAPTERIFSMVRKNHTEFRPSLSTKALSALLVEKSKNFANSQVCYKKKFSKQELNAAKHATRLSLSERKE